MSIRTEIDLISNEVVNQSDLLDQAIIALLGKTAGGGAGGISPDDIASRTITGDIVLSVTSIGAYAFAGNAGITSLFAPNVTAVGTYAFYNSTGLDSIYIPNCASISTYCFYASPVTALSLPECTTIGDDSFYNSKQLATLDLPKCKTIGAACFAYNLAKRITLPECTSIGSSSLTNCPNLEYVDLPKCTSFAGYVLRNNKKLKTLILRSETLCTGSSSILNSTMIAGKTGYIYVPAALVENYKVASRWSTFATQFRALEDYTVDGTITGALDESKI